MLARRSRYAVPYQHIESFKILCFPKANKKNRMRKTFSQVTEQIAALQKEAAALLSVERLAALLAARHAVALYGLNAAELGLLGPVDRLADSPNKSVTSPIRPKTGGTAGLRVAAKYRDGAGNAWSGRGMKPNWLSAAIKAGKTLESFAVSGSSVPGASVATVPGAPSKSSPKPKRKIGNADKRGKALTGVKFSDREGHTWSGRGPTPKWLSIALAAGKSRDDFRV